LEVGVSMGNGESGPRGRPEGQQGKDKEGSRVGGSWCATGKVERKRQRGKRRVDRSGQRGVIG
jgi:hypothetical protein